MALQEGRLNKLHPTIGMHNGRSVLRWDPAARCNEHCAIYEDCPYAKGKKCGLETAYMNTVFNNLVDPDNKRGIGDLLNDVELQRVGLHLIPLYHQLIRMKKEAYAVKQMMHVNKQGTIKVHPVFAEIREIIRCISKEIHDLKINEKWDKKFGSPMNVGTGTSIEELMERGDPGFYESLSAKE